ncbi:MAG: MBL fold metallo-hydrolase, partial [Nitrospirae bacterium]|nr:MBL fold metallo-hydrolase [Nitrospirota bacterium]
MKIRFLGGTRTVTGSCFHLSVNGLQLLVDCGMHQGEDSDENRSPFPFKPDEIDLLFLTHAHIDHSGLIPKLVKEGFKGRILTTSASTDLAEVMLYDSAHIQEKDTEWINKKNRRAGRDDLVEPIYTVEDVKNAIPLFERKAYGHIERLDKGLKYRFVDAGHILGSGTLQLWYQDSPV